MQRRPYDGCPIEPESRNIARMANRQAKYRFCQDAELLPEPVLLHLLDRVLPWLSAYEQAHPFCTSEERIAALTASHLGPELRRLLRAHPREMEGFRLARMVSR